MLSHPVRLVLRYHATLPDRADARADLDAVDLATVRLLPVVHVDPAGVAPAAARVDVVHRLGHLQAVARVEPWGAPPVATVRPLCERFVPEVNSC